MSDEELLEELRLLGQWLQGLGVGPRPAEMEKLFEKARVKLAKQLVRLRAWQRIREDERAIRN